MKKIDSIAIFRIASFFNPIFSTYEDLSGDLETNLEPIKTIDINKAQLDDMLANTSTNEYLNRLFTKWNPPEFEIIVENSNFKLFFIEKLLINSEIDDLNFLFEKEDQKAIQSLLKNLPNSLKKIMLEFYFYVIFKNREADYFDKETLKKVIGISIHSEFFFKTIFFSVKKAIFPSNFKAHEFFEIIFTKHFFPFLKAFDDLKIPEWDFYSSNIIESIRIVSKRLLLVDNSRSNEKAELLVNLVLNSYSFLNNILFLFASLVDDKLLGYFDFKFRNEEFIKIIKNGLEDNPFNSIYFYHEVDALWVFGDSGPKKSFRAIKKLPSAQDLTKLALSDLIQLQNQFFRSIKEIESNHNGFKNHFMNTLNDKGVPYRGFDNFYKSFEALYNSHLNLIEEWKNVPQKEKNKELKKLIKTKLDIENLFHIHQWRKVFLESYRQKISLLEKEIENLFLLNPEEGNKKTFNALKLFLAVGIVILILLLAFFVIYKKSKSKIII